MADRILRLPAVMERTGLKRSTLYDWMRQGTFPQPIKLGERAVGWPESAVAEWIASRTPKPAAA